MWRWRCIGRWSGTGVEVTATAPVGGVFDVERFFLSCLANTTTVTLPLAVAYLLLAYDDSYDIYERPADVLLEPYAATVPGLFDMEHFWDDLLAGLPPTSRELLTASFFRAVARSTRRCPLRTCSCRCTGSGSAAPTSPWSGSPSSITSTAGSRPCPARWSGSGPLTDPPAVEACRCQRCVIDLFRQGSR